MRTTTPDIRAILEQGHANLRASKAATEAVNKGHGRVGSVGCLTESGDVYGTCHRKAVARSLGIEEPPSLGTQIMWKAGEANEDTWMRVLGAAGADLVLLQHDDAAIKAKLDGVDLEVLGHPDIVLAREEAHLHVITDQAEADLLNGSGPLHVGIGSVIDERRRVPVLGLELKGIFGYSTGALVYFDGKPKNENLVQAAAYSHFLGIPYVLAYTSASYLPVNFYDAKKHGGLKTIKPFYRMFYLEWRDGTLFYQNEFESDWVETKITAAGIENYYRLVQDAPRVKNLWKRVNANYVDGTPNKWGPQSDCKFCPFARACDRYEEDADYEAWVDGAKRAVANVAQE